MAPDSRSPLPDVAAKGPTRESIGQAGSAACLMFRWRRSVGKPVRVPTKSTRPPSTYRSPFTGRHNWPHCECHPRERLASWGRRKSMSPRFATSLRDAAHCCGRLGSVDILGNLWTYRDSTGRRRGNRKARPHASPNQRWIEPRGRR